MYLTRTQPETNLHRFYRLEIVRGLFGDWGLVRNWGRIGSSGQVRTDWFETEAEAKDARLELHMAKAKRGYDSRKWDSTERYFPKKVEAQIDTTPS